MGFLKIKKMTLENKIFYHILKKENSKKTTKIPVLHSLQKSQIQSHSAVFIHTKIQKETQNTGTIDFFIV